MAWVGGTQARKLRVGAGPRFWPQGLCVESAEREAQVHLAQPSLSGESAPGRRDWSRAWRRGPPVCVQHAAAALGRAWRCLPGTGRPPCPCPCPAPGLSQESGRQVRALPAPLISKTRSGQLCCGACPGLGGAGGRLGRFSARSPARRGREGSVCALEVCPAPQLGSHGFRKAGVTHTGSLAALRLLNN